MKALIITGKYAQDIEVFYPLYRMQEDGIEVHIACKDKQECLGVYGMPIRPTVELPTVDPTYDLVILPGGARAMEYLRQEYAMLNWLKVFPGPIGVICHGTQLMISAGLVKGRRISGYYSIKDDIINAGGIYDNAWEYGFVTDGKIVSSSHYKHLGPWMREVLRVAKG